MAAVFSNPVTLVYHVGHNLIMNGIDIYEKLDMGVIAYKKGDYYSFGYNVGEGMAEVFLYAPK